MWLILCDAQDASAAWLHAQLRRRGLGPLVLLRAAQLALAEFREHRLEQGRATLRLRTEDGVEVDAARLRGVFNRLYSVPTAHWRRATQADQDYVLQEQVALYLSWLHALPCPVINRPTPQGLCGAWRMESEWAWLAHRAGLPVPPYRQTSRDRVDESRGERRLAPPGAAVSTAIVVDGRVHGAPALDAGWRAGCARLAALARTRLLGVEYRAGDDGQALFCGANPMPELRPGGDSLVDDLLSALRGGVDAIETRREAA